MSSNFTVIYDAGVLYPAPLRDLLMRLALTDLYRARWTDMIHDEWTRNVLKQRPDLKAEDLQRTRSLMNSHVQAAQHPDDFIFDLLDLHAARVCETAANHRRSLKNPPKTADEYLDTLLKQGLTQTVGLLREWKAAI
ncbi:MAG: hypothetical protein RLZZ300_904 [Pseudomonadota bacterium]